MCAPIPDSAALSSSPKSKPLLNCIIILSFYPSSVEQEQDEHSEKPLTGCTVPGSVIAVWD